MELTKSSAMYLVLIETLWNVKTDEYAINPKRKFVLIETLWNVKKDRNISIPLPEKY